MKLYFFSLTSLLLLCSITVSANCYDSAQSAKNNYMHCKQAAEGGDSIAQYFIGQMYRKGDGIEKNPQEALVWYQKAAAQNNIPALYNLGWMHENGTGIPRNLEEAIRWYTKAASHGDKFAPFNIGSLYYSGRDLPKNVEKALFWFDLAILNGNEKGRKWRAKIAENMLPEQQEQINQRVQAWKTKHIELNKNP